jgi:hypothetical protein
MKYLLILLMVLCWGCATEEQKESYKKLPYMQIGQPLDQTLQKELTEATTEYQKYRVHGATDSQCAAYYVTVKEGKIVAIWREY